MSLFLIYYILILTIQSMREPPRQTNKCYCNFAWHKPKGNELPDPLWSQFRLRDLLFQNRFMFLKETQIRWKYMQFRLQPDFDRIFGQLGPRHHPIFFLPPNELPKSIHLLIFSWSIDIACDRTTWTKLCIGNTLKRPFERLHWFAHAEDIVCNML